MEKLVDSNCHVMTNTEHRTKSIGTRTQMGNLAHRRGSKQVNFIALNDGSTINNLQVVVDLANFDEEMLKLITTGACISVNGEMVESVVLFYQSFPFNLFFLDTRRRGLKRKIHFFLLSFPVLCQVVIY